MSATVDVGRAAVRRRAGWVLALTPVPFAAAAGCAVALDLGPLQDVTAARLGEVAAGWVAFHLAFVVAIAAGAWGLGVVHRGNRVSSLLAGAAVAAVVTAALRVAMLGAGGGRLGDLPTFEVALAGSLLAVWLATAATVLTGAALRRIAGLRRVGGIVAVVAALYLLADIVTGGGFPPFVVSLLWLVLGVSVLVRRVPSAA
jgi:hypothetical protein